jgi:5-methylcytosine-specific restriction endonuclease McrA
MKDKKTYNQYMRSWQKKNRFGGLRDMVLKRDNYSCVCCGMTQKEHIEKWGKDITIDHVDGNGRYSGVPNNEIDNLKTMCLACHGKKDAKRGWDNGFERHIANGEKNGNAKTTNITAKEIRESNNVSLKDLSGKYGLSYQIIWSIKHNLTYFGG